MSDETGRQDFERSYKLRIERIALAVRISDEVEQSTTIKTLRSALAKDANDAAMSIATIDIADAAKLREIQLAVALHKYFEDILIAVDKRHQADAMAVLDMERGNTYE